MVGRGSCRAIPSQRPTLKRSLKKLDRAKRLRLLIALASLILTPFLSQAQTIEAVSREVSLFNFNQPTANYEAVSREVSLFNFNQPMANYEAVSREVSLFNFNQPTANREAVSREVSLFNFNQPTVNREAVSREVSLFNFNQPTVGLEAISREVSLFDRGSNSFDAISREVSLYDYGYNHLTLAIGSTVMLAGTFGGVPVTFSTLMPVTNVQVAVDFPQDLLTNWSVQPQSPLTGMASVSNNSRLHVTFSPAGGQSISNAQQLGQITFASASNQPSAFLPLQVAGAAAPMWDGTTDTPYKTTQNGEVVVLNSNSLLRANSGTNGQEYLTLYGLSGINYTIASATNLAPPAVWRPVYALTPTNFIAITPGIATTNPAMFFRARQ